MSGGTGESVASFVQTLRAPCVHPNPPLMMTRLVLAAFLVATLSACGSDTLEPGDDTTINGSVTSDDASAKAPVEGAVVTAAAVSGSGSLSALDGTATTDAEGSFSLTTEATLDPVVLSASATGFASRALLEAGAA
ncbi:MAG TPA: carboxypeptidase regulatory-like domain-containing protein, partial [Rhodothermales bacterium]|nr:carboxypeptidase regulatory-like domain-containing protein [Rhodothermales bacterium]